jgi:hypothetical protein
MLVRALKNCYVEQRLRRRGQRFRVPDDQKLGRSMECLDGTLDVADDEDEESDEFEEDFDVDGEMEATDELEDPEDLAIALEKAPVLPPPRHRKKVSKKKTGKKKASKRAG